MPGPRPTLWRATNPRTSPAYLRHPRGYAAAALFRITGNSAYQNQFSNDVSSVTSTTVLGQGESAYPVMLYALTGGVVQPNASLLNRMRSSVLATADEYGITTSSKRSLRWGGHFYMPMLVGQQTTPAILEVAVGHAVARKTNPSKAQQYLAILYTTCDYFLGVNSLNMTWVTGLGARCPNQVFHIDAWCRGYHPGIIPYGPWRTETDNPTWVTDHDWPNLTVFPAITNWPGNERWFDNRWSPMNSEFTVHQNAAPAAAIFGLLCAPGPAAPAAPPAVALSITDTHTNAFVLSWPAESTGGLVLQQNSDFSSTNWTTVPVLPVDDGTNKRVTLAPSLTQQLFRLKWP